MKNLSQDDLHLISQQAYLSEEDEEGEYASLPFGQPLASGWKATSPDICSSYYPSDRESGDEEEEGEDRQGHRKEDSHLSFRGEGGGGGIFLS